MDSLQATHDLGATPWADMRGDEWPVGLITRVGLAPGKLNPAERSVAIVISLPDGKRVVRAALSGVDPVRTGTTLGRNLLEQGAEEILKALA